MGAFLSATKVYPNDALSAWYPPSPEKGLTNTSPPKMFPLATSPRRSSKPPYLAYQFIFVESVENVASWLGTYLLSIVP